MRISIEYASVVLAGMGGVIVMRHVKNEKKLVFQIFPLFGFHSNFDRFKFPFIVFSEIPMRFRSHCDNDMTVRGED